jgi:4-hydroxy-4-methyl-2-oxoglutarate aldolase
MSQKYEIIAKINHKRIDKPTLEDIRNALEGYGVAQVFDGLGYHAALGSHIKPLPGQKCAGRTVVGTALTVDAGQGDNLGVYAGIHFAESGDVLVVSTGAYKTTAVMGDLMLKMAKNKGITCLVTDGLIRDSSGMLDVDLPMYCAGTNPAPPVRLGPCSVGLPILIGGTIVRSGDMIVGDIDGIGVVPAGMVPKIVPAIKKQIAYETELEEKIEKGLVLGDDIIEIIEKNSMIFD